MTDPKKNTKPDELLRTAEEKARNKSVTEQSTTKEFAKNAKEVQGIAMDENGKAKPIIQKRKIQQAKPGSGKKTRVIGEDGSVLYELEPGSDKEKRILYKIRLQEEDTNKRREHNADVVNQQTGDTNGNPVYEKKLKEQTSRVRIKK